VANRYGSDTMAEIEWTAWTDQVVPELERMKGQFSMRDEDDPEYVPVTLNTRSQPG
jgi:hypothetical protein